MALEGTISPRNIDTTNYEVLEILPRGNLPKKGEKFSAWPWGIEFAHLCNYGPIVMNGELIDWIKQGKLKVLSALLLFFLVGCQVPATSTTVPKATGTFNEPGFSQMCKDNPNVGTCQ